MIKLVFFVPVDNKDDVLNSLFQVGAGRIGNYDSCCFVTEGMGQFRPLKDANPAQGKVGEVNMFRELKVEMVLEDHLKDKVKEVLLDSHPYETPAYEFYQLLEC